MTVTVDAAVLGTFKSIARATQLSAAAANSETLILNHGLGVSPEIVTVQARNVVAPAVLSLGLPICTVDSWDATAVTITMEADQNVDTAVQYDVVCEVEHSLVR